MPAKNKVLKSVNFDGDLRCVDIFERPDGSFGFEEYRRDVEDDRGWFAIGGHRDKMFPTVKAAFQEARNKVPWLTEQSCKAG